MKTSSRYIAKSKLTLSTSRSRVVPWRDIPLLKSVRKVSPKRRRFTFMVRSSGNYLIYKAIDQSEHLNHARDASKTLRDDRPQKEPTTITRFGVLAQRFDVPDVRPGVGERQSESREKEADSVCGGRTRAILPENSEVDACSRVDS